MQADMADAGYTDRYGGAVVGSVMLDDGQMSGMTDLGEPHLAIGGMIVLLIGLVYFSHKNVGSLSSIKLTLLDIFSIGFVAATFNVLAKVGSAKLTAAGVVIPGLPETVALF